jgi:hypothetical protein
MTKYPEYAGHYYKTGKALAELYCENCGQLIHKKGEKVKTAFGEGDEVCCSNCDHTLHRRSPGGQSDTWGFKVKDKPILKINKREFLDWWFGDVDANTVVEDIYNVLLEEREYKLSLDNIYKGLTYIPTHVIMNEGDIPEKIVDNEIETPALKYDFEWVG